MTPRVSGVEIERKFVVDEAPEELEPNGSSHIRQGYLAIGEDGAEVRLRDRDGERTLTAKQGRGRVRAEEEIELDEDAFERLWPLTEGARLEKRRHLIPADADLTIEIDVYANDLEGLVIAEIEFPSEDAAAGFRGPDWLGAEVTDDPRFKAQALAARGPPGAA